MTLSAISSVTSTLHVIALIGHLVGIAFGVGGATVTDLVFVSCVRRRRTDHTLQVVMEVATRCVMVGLGLLIVSGFALIAPARIRVKGSGPKWSWLRSSR